MKYSRINEPVILRKGFRLAQLQQAFVFFVNCSIFVIPIGFWFDGASIPTFALWFARPFMRWAYEAALVHDWFYRNYRLQVAKLWDDGAYRILTRWEMDRLFLVIMVARIHDCIPESAWFYRARRARLICKARTMYRAVRAGGGFVIGDGFGDMPESLKRSIDRAGYKL